MMTMEQVKAEQAKLAAVEKKLLDLKKIKRLDKLLTEEQFMVSVTKVEGSFTNETIPVSLMLTDAEQAALGKSVQVILEFARQRIEKEIENA